MSAEIVKEKFVTHVGRVIVNNYGAVTFEPNCITKNILHVDTIRDLHRVTKEAVREMKAEGTYKR